MGPTSLFDKSFIQSLNINEAVWFDNFYRANISPIFYAETLADLSIGSKSREEAEVIVRNISSKTPELSSVPNIHHSSLILNNLLGYEINMKDFRPMIAGGIPTSSEGKKGYRFEVSKEAEAFNRWQNEEFYELERDFAKSWREEIKNLSFEFEKGYVRDLSIDINSCKNLDCAYELAERLISLKNEPKLFSFFLSTLSISSNNQSMVIQMYMNAGFPSLLEFAPYVSHIMKIDMFFYISISRGFISDERPSNKIDMTYLYYLPFCNIFISGDKLHKKTAHYFMQKNQKFIWAPDLKSDLGKLNEHYENLSTEVKEQGLYSFASYPPEADFLTTRLWDRYLPRWRITKDTGKKSKNNESLLSQVKKHAEAPIDESINMDILENDIEHLTLKRSVSKKRGDWYQVPKNLKNDD